MVISAQKRLEPDQQEPKGVADGGEDGVGCIAFTSGQVIVVRPVG
jgi:hypothetical protein